MVNQPKGQKSNTKRDRGKQPARKPQQAPHQAPRAPVAPRVRLSFFSTSEWDLAKLDASVGVQDLYFGGEFEIQDEHILAIAARPQLTQHLETLRAGSSDTGNGGRVSDAALLELIPHLQAITSLDLGAFNQITGVIFPSLATLPFLATLSLTGHDRSHGRVTSKSILDLKASKSLRKATFYDQSINDKDAKALSKINGGIQVGTGDTDGDGAASQMIASMGAGGMITWHTNGKMEMEMDW
ncbi:hypothetical protein RQP46_002610 [Phenoliferia psychrophenolica]